ncbi:hypothetical protein SPSIL_056490 [Sporomusa silvacetica DSM 10669]|uniref:Uncharacterized protein n=1 Tax=Sporomusa silvacetica DSM 10669 TaxID=1123289 RepID=A0ABZ3IUM1_9FIRM|nr:hypothetical protein SPSIL_56860 [Sporomusa silvacetica DSM 10669]
MRVEEFVFRFLQIAVDWDSNARPILGYYAKIGKLSSEGALMI